MSSVFALIPAAGFGARMAHSLPKQYLPLCGRPLIAHCLAAFAAVPVIEKIFVVLSPNDTLWAQQPLHDLPVTALYVGGETRAESVANGLAAIADQLQESDWVMVHDAARPCLTPEQVTLLIRTLQDDPVGGLLATPVADTLKRADAQGRVAATPSREHLWQAQTPQMFRFGLLRAALQAASDVTDEASAIEFLGHQPLLVSSDPTNFKVTRPQDLLLAQWVLESRSDTA